MTCLPFNIEITKEINSIYHKLINLNINNNDIVYKIDISRINSITSSLYIPGIISHYINNNKSIKVTLFSKINNNNFTINLFFFKKTLPNIKLYYKNILLILSFLSKYLNKTDINFTINIYFTHFTKNYDIQNNIVNPINVNTGVTSITSSNIEIQVYREEEWFKVLIHELIHAFNFDFRENYPAFKELKKYYDIDSDFNLNESYVEFWARLINVIYFCQIKSNNKSQFNINFKKYFKKEILHSIDSGLKILSLIAIHKSDYKENSNVFAYYIITSLLMINYQNFLNWCNNNNDNLINVKSEKNITNKFVNKIIEYNKNSLTIDSYLCGNIKDDSLTMTTIDIFK